LSRDSRREAIIEEGGKVFRAYQTSNDNFDQAIADHLGMNRTDMRCVDLIDQAGGMTAGELARAAGLTTGAVTAVIDRLERAGMARRGFAPPRPVRIDSDHADTPGQERFGPGVHGGRRGVVEKGQVVTVNVRPVIDVRNRFAQQFAGHS